MEELQPAVPGDLERGSVPERWSLAIQAIRKLHASWGGRDQSALPNGARPLPRADASRFDDACGQFAERYHELLAGDIVAGLDVLARGAEQPRIALRSSAMTLLHQDFSARNIMFGDGISAPLATIVDWQQYECELGRVT